jgi:hypothetical protein
MPLASPSVSQGHKFFLKIRFSSQIYTAVATTMQVYTFLLYDQPILTSELDRETFRLGECLSVSDFSGRLSFHLPAPRSTLRALCSETLPCYSSPLLALPVHSVMHLGILQPNLRLFSL